MRVAIYARVSTDDKGQNPENQLRELRAWCLNSGHKITHEYVEHESGRKGADKRSTGIPPRNTRSDGLKSCKPGRAHLHKVGQRSRI
jgi:Resolvase, N terminal domain